jgi:hypothetical protein
MIINVVTANSIFEIDPVARKWGRVHAGAQSGKLRTTFGDLVALHECRVGRALRMEVAPVEGTQPLARLIITTPVVDIYVEGE